MYFTEVQNGTIHVDANETIYTLWIGTNDVSCNALLTGEGEPGVTLVNTTECAVNWVKTLYDNGARNFLFQNVGPPAGHREHKSVVDLPAILDDPLAKNYSLLRRFLPKWILVGAAKYDGVEYLHDRNGQRQQCVVKGILANSRAYSPRRPCW